MKSVGIILAAGRGIRMGSLGATIPKGLLKINGLSLIERQIKSLRACTIKKIYAVVGFAEDTVKQAFGDDLNYIYNPRWDTANNIYSLYLAREVADKGFVLINSDDLFHHSILTSLLTYNHPDAISIDDRKKLGEEEIKVTLKNGFLCEINKTMDAKIAHGEYIGLAKFGPQGAQELFAVLDDFVKRDDVDGWYEEAFEVLGQRRPISGVSTKGLPWIEIDTPEDFEKAENEIMPAISRG